MTDNTQFTTYQNLKPLTQVVLGGHKLLVLDEYQRAELLMAWEENGDRPGTWQQQDFWMAKDEGWILADLEGKGVNYEIQKLDDESPFATDEDAAAFVAGKAFEEYDNLDAAAPHALALVLAGLDPQWEG